MVIELLRVMYGNCS